jgi:hypothetical protein
MLDGAQQLGIDPGQPRQSLGVQAVILFPALSDQPHLARMRDDHLVSQIAQQSADPGRMRPRLQCDSAARHAAEHFSQGVRIRAHALLQLYLASFIQHAVPTVAIPQIQSDGQFQVANISALSHYRGANLLHCRSPCFICALSTSITWERTPHPVRRPAFSSHLLTTVDEPTIIASWIVCGFRYGFLRYS